MPRPEKVYGTCNRRGAYVHQVPLLYFGDEIVKSEIYEPEIVVHEQG